MVMDLGFKSDPNCQSADRSPATWVAQLNLGSARCRSESWGEIAKTNSTPIRNEAELKRVPLRSLVEGLVVVNSVKGQDERPGGRP